MWASSERPCGSRAEESRANVEEVVLMPIVGGYSIDLYCDCPKYVGEDTRHPGSFAGYNKQDAYGQARKRGWKFKRDGGVIAPGHEDTQQLERKGSLSRKGGKKRNQKEQ